MELPLQLTPSHRLGVLCGKVRAFLEIAEARGVVIPAEVEGILLQALLDERKAQSAVMARAIAAEVALGMRKEA